MDRQEAVRRARQNSRRETARFGYLALISAVWAFLLGVSLRGIGLDSPWWWIVAVAVFPAFLYGERRR